MSGAGEVIDFVARVLGAEGALVESTDGERLDALLTPALRARLDAPGELVQLVDRAGVESGELPCGYGSEVLARIVDVAIGGGRVVAVDSGMPPRERRNENPIAALNVACRVVSSRSVRGVMLIATARFTALGDDERIGQVRAAVLSPGLVPVTAPDPSIALSPGNAVRPEKIDVRRLEAAIPALLVELERVTTLELHAFRAAVARRKARDAKRLVRYFTDMVDDLAQRQKRSAAAALRSKLDAMPEEFERRFEQLRAETSLRVRLDLLGLEVVLVPTRVLEIEVKRRRNSRCLDVYHDGFAHRWAGLRCDGCGAATLAIALCDDAAHVLCAECWNECGTGGHRPCFRCAGKPLRRAWESAPVSREPRAGAPVAESLPRGVATVARASERTPSARESVRDDGPEPAAPDVVASPMAAASLEALRARVVDVLRGAREPLTSGEIRSEILPDHSVDAPTLRRVLDPLLSGGEIAASGDRRGRRYCWVADDSGPADDE